MDPRPPTLPYADPPPRRPWTWTLFAAAAAVSIVVFLAGVAMMAVAELRRAPRPTTQPSGTSAGAVVGAPSDPSAGARR